MTPEQVQEMINAQLATTLSQHKEEFEEKLQQQQANHLIEKQKMEAEIQRLTKLANSQTIQPRNIKEIDKYEYIKV